MHNGLRAGTVASCEVSKVKCKLAALSEKMRGVTAGDGHRRRAIGEIGPILIVGALLLICGPASAQQLADPIPDAIPPGRVAELVDFVQIPSDRSSGFAPIQYLHHAGDGSGRLFVADLRGQVWLIEDGVLAPEPFLDAAAILGDALRAGCNSCGVRSFAFHPDFAKPARGGFGRFYTVTIQAPETSAARPATPIFRWTKSPVATVDVVSEWRVDPEDPNRIDPTSEREVLRVEQWRIGHSTEHIGFKPNARRRDPDFGKLFIALGDGGFNGDDPDPFRNAQDTRTVLGKILRIIPRRSGRPGYRIPRDNPFVGDPDVLPEIWASGLRNPQRFSWDAAGRGAMLIADIGQAGVEEINLGIAGANYGWREREGAFVLDPSDPSAVLPLPPDDAAFGFTYPIAQYDHDLSLVPSGLAAVTGGFVYRGREHHRLRGEYLFGDLVSGRSFTPASRPSGSGDRPASGSFG
jgi:hypothetical protein